LATRSIHLARGTTIGSWLTTAAVAGTLITSAPALAAVSPTGQPETGHGLGTLVHTRSGVIEGARAGRVLRFLGVPYAQPPVGALRWRPPRPVRPWPGVRPAERSGPPCQQWQGAPLGSENCLYLDVTVPRRPGPKPVLVFLHGGGLTTGSGSDYDPARMAVQGDVIVVTVDFRLGIFGFFGHAGLPGSGTFGLQDQQAALRWVRANIAAFGGEPANVTLSGQSGGAVSTCAQLTSPRSAGLFQRAIMESGDCQLSWPRDAMYPPGPAGSFFQPLAAVDRRGQAAGRALRCDRGSDRADLACLRALPPRALAGQNDRFGVAATGNPVLPLNPATALRRGRFHRVPVMLGQTRDEHRLIAGIMADLSIWITARHYPALIRESFGTHTPAVLRRYPLSRYHHDAEVAWSAVFTDRIWACGQVGTAGDLARFTPVYTYEFADEHAQPLANLPAGFPAGASHGSELMDLFDVAGRQLITSSYYTRAQRRLAHDLITYWTTFARTGRPSSAGLPAWPATRPGYAERPALQLAPGPGGIRPVDAAAEHQCAFWRR
jgi:para-nitrobenzyl esterase